MPSNPFTNPKPKGEPDYWLREFDEKIAEQHRRLLQELEKREKRGPGKI